MLYIIFKTYKMHPGLRVLHFFQKIFTRASDSALGHRPTERLLRPAVGSAPLPGSRPPSVRTGFYNSSMRMWLANATPANWSSIFN